MHSHSQRIEHAELRAGLLIPTGLVKPAGSGSSIPNRFDRPNRLNLNLNSKAAVLPVRTGLSAGLAGLQLI